jgi:hypothetical protein
MDPNSLEVELLHHNPTALLLQYQELITVIVQVYQRSGNLDYESREEIIQYVNDKLLERMENIRLHYNGKALLRTYFSAVIRNLCSELQRERQKEDLVLYFQEPVECESYEVSALNRIVISQELTRLADFLSLFASNRAKVEACLRSLYRLPMTNADFTNCVCNPKDPAVKESVRALLRPGPMMDKEVFYHLNIVFNLACGNEVHPDTMRKWVKARMKDLIDLLNGNPRRANYDEETLQILLEKYYIEQPGPLTVPMDGSAKKRKNYRPARKNAL